MVNTELDVDQTFKIIRKYLLSKILAILLKVNENIALYFVLIKRFMNLK